MFSPGFLGTRAPFYMDFLTLSVIFLPLLIWLGILIARRGYYETHRIYQSVLFVISLILVLWFEYGVRMDGSFSKYLKAGTVDPLYVHIVLYIHIPIAVFTLILWVSTLFLANKNYRARNLPGGYTLRHRRLGTLCAFFIFLTSLSGLWLYLLLFAF